MLMNCGVACAVTLIVHTLYTDCDRLEKQRDAALTQAEDLTKLLLSLTHPNDHSYFLPLRPITPAGETSKGEFAAHNSNTPKSEE